MTSIKQIINKAQATYITGRILLLLGVIFLSILVGVVIGKGIIAGQWVIILISGVGFGLFVVKKFGLSPFFIAYAVLSWNVITFNYASLSTVTISEAGIYFVLLVLLLGVFSSNINVAWKQLFDTPGFFPLMGFMLGAIVAFFTGPNIANDLNFYYLRHTVFYSLAIYITIANCISKPKDAIYILVGLIIGGVFFASELSFNINGMWNPMQRIMETRDAGYSFNGLAWNWGWVPLATYISLTLALAATLALNSKRIVSILLFSAASILLSIMLILTEGRAGFVATGVSLLTILILSTYRNHEKLWKITLFGLFLVIAVIVLISSGLVNQSLFIRLQGFSNITEDGNLLERVRIWLSTLYPLLTNPLGVGFAYWVTKTGHSAHNELLEITLGSGFLGAFFYLLFFFIVIKNFVQGIKSVDRTTRILCIAALGCCVSYAINGIGDSPSVNNIWGWQVLWIVLASVTGVLRNTPHTHPIPNGSSAKLEE